MRIGGGQASERQPDEAMYVGYETAAPYHLLVPRSDALGGWIATPTDLLRVLLRADVFPHQPTSSCTNMAAMTTRSLNRPTYARGWAVNSARTRWHDGVCDGTQSILVRTAGQHEWTAVCNAGRPGTALASEIDALKWKADGAARCRFTKAAAPRKIQGGRRPRKSFAQLNPCVSTETIPSLATHEARLRFDLTSNASHA